MFCVFLVGLIDTVHVILNSTKYRFLDKFGSYNTIYIFKNYFVTVFLIISFPFLTNRRYPNTFKVDETDPPIR